MHLASNSQSSATTLIVSSRLFASSHRVVPEGARDLLPLVRPCAVPHVKDPRVFGGVVPPDAEVVAARDDDLQTR